MAYRQADREANQLICPGPIQYQTGADRPVIITIIGLNFVSDCSNLVYTNLLKITTAEGVLDEETTRTIQTVLGHHAQRLQL
jgi:hypothetical protein